MPTLICPMRANDAGTNRCAQLQKKTLIVKDIACETKNDIERISRIFFKLRVAISAKKPSDEIEMIRNIFSKLKAVIFEEKLKIDFATIVVISFKPRVVISVEK